MFRNHKKDERSFGQFELLSIVPSLVSGAFSVGGALIQSSAAKSIASAQQETQLSIAQMQANIQTRWQELELQKIQEAKAALQPTGIPGTVSATSEFQSLTAGIIPESILGIPILYLAIGTGFLFLLSRKSGRNLK